MISCISNPLHFHWERFTHIFLFSLSQFVKIQPQSVDFLNITDPKAVLENAFRNFTTLTQGDIIQFKYNEIVYDILVLEAKPEAKGISIIETDLEVDFAAPLGYVEPERVNPVAKVSQSLSGSIGNITQHAVEDKTGFAAFNGSGNKLNGRKPVDVK